MDNELLGLITEKGVEIPLVSVDVKADLTGRAAKVRVTQTFMNRENRPVEAVYKFPLPEGSAICGFRAKIGDRTVIGKVADREKAFELYDEALMKGHGAYLLDEERPNIFTLSVGNLNPGVKAVIEIDYVSLLETHGTEVRFFLPTTISPRYVPENMPDDQGIPVDKKVNPAFALDVPYEMRVKISIHDKDGIAAIESPSHTISTSIESSPAVVEFSSGSAKMDRDFVLNIRYRKGFETRGYFYEGKQGKFIQIDFSAVMDGKELIPASPREVIFVLDCSGSMEGSSINEAKKAIEIFVRGLSEGVKFNVYRFGSTYEKLFESSEPYTEATVKKALGYISGINADLGGTEVLAPLKDIYRSTVALGLNRQVILITDGEVGNEEEVLELVRNGSGMTRVFTVGIGYGPNEYFIGQVAKSASGASELIAPGERIEPKVLRLFKKVMSDNIDDLRISWPEPGFEAAPATPVAYQGDVISVFGRAEDISKSIGDLKITGVINGRPMDWSVPIAGIRAEEAPVPLLWAREMIRDLEEGAAQSQGGSRQKERKDSRVRERIIELSKHYGIVSRETSFVAIEEREGKETTKEAAVLKKIPVMLTKGWGGIRRSTSHRSGVAYSIAMPVPCCEDAYSIADKSMMQVTPRRMGPPKADPVMSILLLQEAKGGFGMSAHVASLLNTTVSELREIAKEMVVKGKSDRFKLLCTALVLALLRIRFAHNEGVWGEIIKKSEVWFKSEINRVDARLEGVSLTEWVESYFEKKGNSLRRI